MEKREYMGGAIFKFNNGQGALLCSGCRVILKIGSEMTEEEKKALKGEKFLPPYFCNKCKDMSLEK